MSEIARLTLAVRGPQQARILIPMALVRLRLRARSTPAPTTAVRLAVLALAALSLGLTGAASATAAPSAAKKTRLGLKRVATGFDAPTHLAAPRAEPRRLYVVEQSGRIWLIERGKRRPKPFLDISNRVGGGPDGPEQGLFSIAFHPDYGTNRKLYVNYTDQVGNTRVVEYRSKGRRARKGTARQVLWVKQSEPNHNGGQLAFGPGGFLYAGMGDGGGPGDPANNGQNHASPLGNLLRLDVDQEGSRWGTVGYGLRNPWRFSFDSETGDLYLSDVGQEAVEEINFTPRFSLGIENYGWNVFEGHARFNDRPVNQRGTLVMPIASYTHAVGCSITGGFVYRGTRMPAARGRYFYGDFCTGRIWSLRVRDGVATSHRRERFTVPQLVSFGQDGRGEIYALSREGSVFKIVRRR